MLGGAIVSGAMVAIGVDLNQATSRRWRARHSMPTQVAIMMSNAGGAWDNAKKYASVHKSGPETTAPRSTIYAKQ